MELAVTCTSDMPVFNCSMESCRGKRYRIVNTVISTENAPLHVCNNCMQNIELRTSHQQIYYCRKKSSCILEIYTIEYLQVYDYDKKYNRLYRLVKL